MERRTENDSETMPKILLIDDEPNILRALQRVLRRLPLEVTTTTSIDEALRLATEETFAVVVSDQRMPQMNGTELLARVREQAPKSVRIMLTGYSDIQAAVDAINHGAVFRYLVKPWNDDELCQTIMEAADEHTRLLEQEQHVEQTLQQNKRLEGLNSTLRSKVIQRTWETLELNQKLRREGHSAVQALVRQAKMHNKQTGLHAQRVAKLVKQLAPHVGLSGETMHQVEVAALLHDVGKTLVAPAVLRKSESSLDHNDRLLLRLHPVHGAMLLHAIPGCEEAARFVRHHHEAFDGSGYPDKLQGSAIPLVSRLIAVASAYDHALYDRKSTGASPIRALREIQSQAGTAFDPDILEVLAGHIAQSADLSKQAAKREIGLQDLQPGMMLAEDLISNTGVLLLSRGSIIEPQQILRLRIMCKSDPILGGIVVWQQREHAEVNVPLSEPRVLIAEDVQPTSRAVANTLKVLGYRDITQVASGEEAYHLLQCQVVDLLIVSRKLPDMQGVELVQALRAMPHSEQVRVIMLGTSNHPEHVLEAVQAGCDVYMLTPIDRHSFEAKLRELVIRHPSVEAAGLRKASS